MKNIPKKMWLQLDGDLLDGVDISRLDFNDLEEVSFCCTHQFDNDVEYVRADQAVTIEENEHKRKILRLALEIIDRLSNEYSELANRHSSFTQGEYNQIMSAIHPGFKEPAAEDVAQN